MFNRNKETSEDTSAVPQPEQETEQELEQGAEKKQRNWLKISVTANIAIVALVVVGLASMEVIHQSDTNPEFCGTCHIMQSHVDSYLTSNHLDNVHAEAGVQCKGCHDYSVPAELASGFRYLTGNYYVDDAGELVKMDFGDEICTQCHGPMEDVAISTDYLYYNPHDSGMGTFACSDCHLSHGEQIDLCNECHDSPGQRLIEDRETIEHMQIGVPVGG